MGCPIGSKLDYLQMKVRRKTSDHRIGLLNHYKLKFSQAFAIPTFVVNLLRCCKQIYTEAAPYVKRRYGRLVVELRTPIHDGPSWKNFMDVFDERVLYRDLGSPMLANIVKLRLDASVCSSDESHFPCPPFMRLPHMSRFRCIEAYLHLQGCSEQPYSRRILINWLQDTYRTRSNQMMVISRVRTCHRHDVAGFSGSCALGRV